MVEFVPIPPSEAGARSNFSSEYDSVRDALAQRPGEYGKFTEVSTDRDLKRWRAAMKYRGVLVSQRKLPDGGWALWGMYNEKADSRPAKVGWIEEETRDPLSE